MAMARSGPSSGVLVLTSVQPAAVDHLQVKAAHSLLDAVGTSSSATTGRLTLLLAQAEAATPDDLSQRLASIKDILEQTLVDRAMTSHNITTVKHTLDALLARVNSTRVSSTASCQNAVLTHRVQSLEGQVQELLQAHTNSCHAALLNQLAYVIDDAVAQYVYGDDYDLCSSLKDTQDDAVNFTPEQQARWARVLLLHGTAGAATAQADWRDRHCASSAVHDSTVQRGREGSSISRQADRVGKGAAATTAVPGVP